MTLTPHRDAVMQTMTEARRVFGSMPDPDPIKVIGGQMSLAATEAVLLGCSDMLDRDVRAGTIVRHVTRALAAAWASLILTLCCGRDGVALAILDDFLADLKERVVERIGAAPRDGIVSDVVRRTPAGPMQ